MSRPPRLFGTGWWNSTRCPTGREQSQQAICEGRSPGVWFTRRTIQQPRANIKLRMIVLAAFLLVVAAGFVWVAVQVARFNVKRAAVLSVRNSLVPDEVEQILSLIEQIGVVPAQGYLGVTLGNKGSDGSLTVQLPKFDQDFPWSGQTIRVSVAARAKEQPVTFQIERDSEPTADRAPIRWLAVPRVSAGKTGRAQNVFAPERYLEVCPPLREHLERLYPPNPKSLLTSLLSANGSTESLEPFDQMRCGVSPGWIQSPRFHKCTECRRPLQLILQVPGSLIASRLAEGTFYLFGCPSHSTNLVSDDDWG